MATDPREWMEFCSQQLVSGLTSNDALRKVTDNPALIGAYAESSVREFVKRFVAPLKLSTGSIVYEGNAGGKVPQLDGIIWHPSPLPPILEAGEFALVPRSAGVAYLEIKRSNYAGIGQKLETTLSLENELVPIWPELEPSGKQAIRRALGVVCLYTDGGSDTALDGLIRNERVAVILRRHNDEAEYVPDTTGILLLVNFLMHIRLRSKLLDGQIILRLPPKATSSQSTTAAQFPTLSTPSSYETTSVEYISPSPSGVRPSPRN